MTEACPIMVWRLRKKGYQVLRVDGWEHRQYDVIACLNVLDRCERPLTLLRSMRDSLTSGGRGRLFVAIVLPYCPFVEAGAKHIQPLERLPVSGNSIEENIHSLVVDVFEPLGLALEVRHSRLPSYCSPVIGLCFLAGVCCFCCKSART